MIEILASWTSLPNLHPAVVHLPIALLPVAVILDLLLMGLKGLLDAQMVVHGHEPALPDGSAGLLFRGQGRVRVLSLKVIPASG